MNKYKEAFKESARQLLAEENVGEYLRSLGYEDGDVDDYDMDKYEREHLDPEKRKEILDKIKSEWNKIDEALYYFDMNCLHHNSMFFDIGDISLEIWDMKSKIKELIDKL